MILSFLEHLPHQLPHLEISTALCKAQVSISFHPTYQNPTIGMWADLHGESHVPCCPLCLRHHRQQGREEVEGLSVLTGAEQPFLGEEICLRSHPLCLSTGVFCVYWIRANMFEMGSFRVFQLPFVRTLL